MPSDLAQMEIDSALLRSVAVEILETMFFVAAEEARDEASPSSNIWCAQVEFHGARRGHLEIQVDQVLGEEMAAGFLGMMDPTELGATEIEQTVKELANIVCGTTLSRFAPDAVFNLDAPRLLLSGEASSTKKIEWLDCGTGRIRLAFAWAPENLA